MLKFSQPNIKTRKLYGSHKLRKYLKINREIYSLDLPSGQTCPGAHNCKSKVVQIGDSFKIQDGPHCEYRCYSAMQEVLYPCVRRIRQHNLNILKSTRGWKNIYNVIMESLPKNAGIVRYHVGGDFFKESYLFAAIQVARTYPDILFYGYTKSLHFLNRQSPMIDPQNGVLLPNFLLTASRGGKFDHLIKPLQIREVVVVGEESEARQKKLPIDNNDIHAATKGGDFALLVHGIQPKGTIYAKLSRRRALL